MDQIGKLLPALFKKQIGRAEPHLLEILVPLWPRIVGKTMAQHSRPALFAFGVLTLNADCATWGTQLRHMTEEIRAGVNGFLGQAIVKKLRIKTVTQPDLFRRPGAPMSRARHPVRASSGKGDGSRIRSPTRRSPRLWQILMPNISTGQRKASQTHGFYRKRCSLRGRPCPP